MAYTLRKIGDLATPETIADAVESTAEDRVAAEAAAAAATAVGTTNDTIMTSVAADSGSDFATQLSNTILDLAGPALIPDPDHPDYGLYLINNPNRLTEDPANPGFYLVNGA